MKYTFLGTGTSQGIPLIGCRCATCLSTDVRDKRLRSSLMVESATTRLVIDIGPDFRYQMLRAGVERVDALVLTHEHNDHVVGLDEVRALNFVQQEPMNIYCTERVEKSLRKRFYYIFENSDYPGIPLLRIHRIGEESFHVGDIELQPLPVYHADMPVLGFRMGDFTYVTDANQIPPATRTMMRHSPHLTLNALKQSAHHSHFSLDEAVALARELGAGQTYFTHISHQMGRHAEVQAKLPPGVQLAYDGLEVRH